jgi:hypothetical protein
MVRTHISTTAATMPCTDRLTYHWLHSDLRFHLRPLGSLLSHQLAVTGWMDCLFRLFVSVDLLVRPQLEFPKPTHPM